LEKSKKNELFDWLKSIAVAVIFVIAMRMFIFSPMLVDGASMMPTYEDGDRVIVNKIGKQFSGIERFDVIVFEAPVGNDYIKRVIGLPGDHIAYEDDILYINGEAIEEPYLDEYKEQQHLLDNGLLTYDFTLESLTDFEVIPEGYLFVLGDNRRKSSDSRDPKVGLVPMEKVLGKANIRFYPFDNVGIVK
jgi:signal peptidase I